MGFVRDTSTLMVAQYFKRKRETVEVIFINDLHLHHLDLRCRPPHHHNPDYPCQVGGQGLGVTPIFITLLLTIITIIIMTKVVVVSGSGLGVTVMSQFLRGAIRDVGWRFLISIVIKITKILINQQP